MHCPVDPHIELVTVSVEGVTIENCSKCGGHWLDRGELAKLASREQDVEPIVSIARNTSRHCPRDTSPLTEIEFPEQSHLKIDVCPECGGIWLDKQELSQALTFLGRQSTPQDTKTPPRPVLDLLYRLSGRRTGS